MATATANLAPITRTAYWTVTRQGKPSRQCSEAVTTDGRYVFVRLELPGTPWVPGDVASKEPLRWQPSLRACQEYAGSGRAAADVARITAHDAGEHAERDPWCLRCTAGGRR